MEYKDLIDDAKLDGDGTTPANPWFHIWTRTGDALHHVFTTQLDFFIHRHFMMLGFFFMLALRLPDWSTVNPHPIGVLIQMLLVGPVGGILAGYVLSAVSRNVGARFGARVDSDTMRAAIAWTNPPLALTWLVFVISYAIVHQMQPPSVQKTIWLFEGALGWVPVLAATLPFLLAFHIRIKGVAYTLQLSYLKAMAVWLVTLILAYAPFIVIGGAFFTIFRTTVSIAQQANG